MARHSHKASPRLAWQPDCRLDSKYTGSLFDPMLAGRDKAYMGKLSPLSAQLGQTVKVKSGVLFSLEGKDRQNHS